MCVCVCVCVCVCECLSQQISFLQGVACMLLQAHDIILDPLIWNLFPIVV